MISGRKWPLIILVCFGIPAFFHFVSLNLADGDSFYYLGLAERHRENGLLAVDFPWTQHSTMRDFSVSLWYGFGMLMIPFSYAGATLGIKTAGILFAGLTLIAFYFVLRRGQIKMPLLWVTILFFAAPNITFRFLMVRPQLLTLGLAALLFIFLVKNRPWGIFLSAFLIAWLHFNFVWMPILVALIVFIFSKTYRSYWTYTALASGLILGWLLRPNPIGALKLFYVQVIKQVFERQSGLPLLYGFEHYPLAVGTLFTNFLLFLLIWTLAAVFLFCQWKNLPKLRPEHRTFLWSSLILSFIFFILSIVVARRAYDFWAIFGVLFIAAAYSYLPSILPFFRQKSVIESGKLLLIGSLVFLIFFSGFKTVKNLKQNSVPPDRLKEAAAWLKNNSRAGDIIFNLHWSDFSPLFYWNRHNYYVGGLDPIFQYSYNPSLYWKFHYLSNDQVTRKTCGTLACTETMLEDTHTVLVSNFRAKYVLVTKKHNPAVNSFLEKDNHFTKKFETAETAIYEIRPLAIKSQQ